MAKIIFIPDWLNRQLREAGVTYEMFERSPVSLYIVSKTDIINYFMAQVEIHNLVYRNLPLTKETSPYPVDLFVHSYSDYPEVKLAISKNWGNEPNLTLLGGETESPVFATIQASPNGKCVYLIGQPVLVSDSTKELTADTALYGILSSLHKGLIVKDGHHDKTTVLRENPLLSQLYVKSFFSRASSL